MNETYKNYIIVALLVACVAFGWFLFSNISDNGARDTDIKQQLSTLETNQRLLTTQFIGLSKDLATSQQRVNAIESRIDNAQTGISHVTSNIADSQKSLTESAGLIAENERIISTIQQRTKGDPKQTEKK